VTSSTPRPCEVSWFAALCDDDYEQLGVSNADLLSSWDHCSRIVATAERHGFDNILLPSGYALGIDSVAFAAGVASRTSTIRLLVAVRCGEMWVPQLARQMATLDRMLDGRLTINIISSEMPGEKLDGEPRYRRTAETMRVLRSLLNGESVRTSGEFVSLELDPPRVRTVSESSPLLYFGGLSEPAREVAAREADVYLMRPDMIEPCVSGIAPMWWCARPRTRLDGPPNTSWPPSTTRWVRRFGPVRWTVNRWGFVDKRSCESPHRTTDTPSPTCGPGSVAVAVGVARPSWEILFRYWRS
jgi:alkanesulfonate monooxygenase